MINYILNRLGYKVVLIVLGTISVYIFGENYLNYSP